VKFWLLLGAAVLAVLAGIRSVYTAVEWWGGPRPDSGPPHGPPGVVVPPPLSHGVPAVAFIVGLFVLGAVFVSLAVRARRKSREPQPPRRR
jgi:hypothetical protein